jgi:DNA-binding MarR family transcriptional regulator
MNREALLNGIDDRRILFASLLSLGNVLQTTLDSFFSEITSKQFFLLICMNLFSDHDPSIKELAEVMQSSHQNVKQLLLKLEKNGFVRTYADESDGRIIRVKVTDKKKLLDKKYDEPSRTAMGKMFHGIDDKAAATTLKTLTQIEQNLAYIRKEKNV